MSRYDIYMQKGQVEDSTPLSPTSPITNNTQSPSIVSKGNVAVLYGTMAAKTTYRTAMAEIKASGNEVLANQMANVTNFATRAALVVGTKGIALIPMTIEGASQVVGTVLERNRENKQTEIENTLRGRNKFVGGYGG
jgi:hypothetical protein